MAGLFTLALTGLSSSMLGSKHSKIRASRIKITPFTNKRSVRIHAKRKTRINGETYIHDPRKSCVDCQITDEFVKDYSMRGLEDVPGIRLSTSFKMGDAGVRTPYQLISMYIGFRDLTTDTVEISDLFYKWLREIGIESDIDTIVQVVARKANSWSPGIYDEEAYP